MRRFDNPSLRTGGGESFDVAQDLEPVERPVEWPIERPVEPPPAQE